MVDRVDAKFEFEYRGQRYEDARRGLEAVSANLKKSLPSAAEALKAELLDYLKSVAKAVADRNSGAWPGGTTDNTLSRRSGHAVSEIRKSPRVSGTTIDTIQGEVGGPFYLRIHEFGGTIRAKNVRYLTIPLKAALRADGTPILPSARQWARTFVITSKKGNLLIVQRNGKTITPLYVLKREVKIPARLGMRKELEKGVPMFADAAQARMVERMMRDHIA